MMQDSGILSLLADLYIPALMLSCSRCLVCRVRQKGWLESAWYLLLSLAGVGIVYGIMGLDAYYQWWPSWGMDYSTHTALAVALILLRVGCGGSIPWLWLGLLPVYGLLMVALGYHSSADVLTTALVTGFLYGPLVTFVRLLPLPR